MEMAAIFIDCTIEAIDLAILVFRGHLKLLNIEAMVVMRGEESGVFLIEIIGRFSFQIKTVL